MKLNELIHSTGTVHKFLPGVGPSLEELKLCLELALLAPNHKKTYPWKFVRASEDSRIRVAEIAGNIKRAAGLSEQDARAAYEKSMAPKELIVFIHDRLPEDQLRERENYATLSCSIQLLALSLRELGYGYKWSSGKLSRSEEVAKLFEVNDSQEIIAFVWIGREASELKRPSRPPLSEFLKEI